MTREQIIEAMARAQYVSEPASSFWLLSDHRIMCDAALSAIEALGYVAVPREATVQQINDAMEGDSNPQDVYRAMIEAGKV